jgi:DNA-binding transcriptional LysR family regulator
MELRHLRYFNTLAEELHFGRAAQRLHISQPSLSFQIRELEEEMKVRLFARTKRSVALTAAGESFAADVRGLFNQLEQAIHTAQRAERGEIGRLVIGFVLTATSSLLPETLRVFRERYPDVELELAETTTGQGLASLAEGRFHLCFVRMPIDEIEPYFIVEPVLREKLLVALPTDHRLASKTKVGLAELSNESFIIFPRAQGIGFYNHLVSLCRQAGFSPRVVQEAGQMQTILSLVAAGIGIALVPDSVQNLRQHDVIYKSLRERMAFETGIAMIWREDDHSALIESFVSVVRTSVKTRQKNSGRA